MITLWPFREVIWSRGIAEVYEGTHFSWCFYSNILGELWFIKINYSVLRG